MDEFGFSKVKDEGFYFSRSETKYMESLEKRDEMVRESRVCTRVVTYRVNETIHTR